MRIDYIPLAINLFIPDPATAGEVGELLSAKTGLVYPITVSLVVGPAAGADPPPPEQFGRERHHCRRRRRRSLVLPSTCLDPWAHGLDTPPPPPPQGTNALKTGPSCQTVSLPAPTCS
jgi:hypothetical protein